MNTKPVVKFKLSEGVIAGRVFEGTYEVYALNHPRLGEQWVRTSAVLSSTHDADGNVLQFETLNTIYVGE